MSDQPSLFDPDPADVNDVISAACSEASPPAVSETGASSATDPDDTDTALLLPPSGSSGNHDDPVLVALRVAGIGLEEIVDLVSGAAAAPPLNSVDAGEVHRWVERAAERVIDPRRVRHLRRAVARLLDAQFVLDHRAGRGSG